MKTVIFSGTSEGRTLCEQLSRAGQEAVACVATEYGKQVMPALPGIARCAQTMELGWEAMRKAPERKSASSESGAVPACVKK